MMKIHKFFGFIILAAISGFVFTGCVGLIFGGGSSRITIRTDSNLSTVRPGGTLRFSAAGQGIIWTVSSTSDGTGPVAAGTNITSSGILTVAVNETYIIIYVIAASSDGGQSEYKQIRVTTVTGVNITPTNQSVTRGRTLQFNAAVTGNNNPDDAVTWRVSSNAAGTGAVTPGTSINANGLLTIAASETLTTLYVIAASIVDPSRSRSVPVAVVIPVVTGVGISPSNQSVTSGRTLQFYASVTGTNIPDNAVTWRVSSNAAGTGAVTSGTGINANGVLTVAANETMTTLYVIAASVEDPSKSGSVLVNVIIPTITGVAVSPANRSVTRGGTLQFNASVTGSNNPSNAVTWKVSSNASGTGGVTRGTGIDANGLLTVAASETMTTLFIIAVSATDPSKSGSVLVNVIVPIVTGVAVSPSTQSITRGGTLQFRASVTGSNNPDSTVRWRVSSNASGAGGVASGTTINNNGILTVGANETAATLYVIATSVADSTKSGNAAVTVTIPPVSGNQNQQGGSRNPQGGNQNQQGGNQNQQGGSRNPQGGNQNQQGQNQQGQNQQAIPAVTGVTISPSNPSVAVGSPLQLSAAVTGSNNPSTAVTWKVSSNAAGTGAVGNGTSINNNGKLTISANETAATLYVTATSVADPLKSGTIAVKVIRGNQGQNSQGQNQQ
ncbi:MAG: Ig-like domain-containing protein [Treponema sp.]|nr:Ig-like domain-containing protein [Treponema sp.]